MFRHQALPSLFALIASSQTGSIMAENLTENIGPLSCLEETACQNNNIEQYYNISGRSCTGEFACSDNAMLEMDLSEGACTGPKSPDKPYGTCSGNTATWSSDYFWASGSTVCSGASSCSNNSANINFGGGFAPACTGKHSCSDNTIGLSPLGNRTCTGDDSCSFNTVAPGAPEGATGIILEADTCTGKLSCRMGRGAAILYKGACSGDSSCQEWKVGNVSDTSTNFAVFQGACSGENSCQKLVTESRYGYVTMHEGSCTGANSCQNLRLSEEMVEMNIEAGACTGDNSCQNCVDTSFFYAGTQDCSGLPPSGKDPNTSGAACGGIEWTACLMGSLLGSMLLLLR